MPQTDPVEIYYSKTAYGFGLFAAVIIFCAGFCFLTIFQNGAGDWTIHLFTQLGAIGLLLIALGGSLGYVYQKKLRVTSPALIIDDEGLTINGNYQTVISWEKIDHFEIVTDNLSTGSSYSSNPPKFIVPVLKDQEEYYSNATKKVLGALDKVHIEATSDQPVSISTNFLKISFDELKDLLDSRLQVYNAKKEH